MSTWFSERIFVSKSPWLDKCTHEGSGTLQARGWQEEVWAFYVAGGETPSNALQGPWSTLGGEAELRLSLPTCFQ
jgi:hypothetical protein